MGVHGGPNCKLSSLFHPDIKINLQIYLSLHLFSPFVKGMKVIFCALTFEKKKYQNILLTSQMI